MNLQIFSKAWGRRGSKTLFFSLDGASENSSEETTANFPIDFAKSFTRVLVQSDSVCF